MPAADQPRVAHPAGQAGQAGQAAHVIPAFVRNQFMYGDCVHLAHALAVRNSGWGVLVAGEASQDDDGWWDTGEITHAWALRPDGALVDIIGVHPRKAAEMRAAQRGTAIHEYAGPTAAENADAVWCATYMELAGRIDPAEAADYVMGRWGLAPVGTLAVVDERDTDPDQHPDEEDEAGGGEADR